MGRPTIFKKGAMTAAQRQRRRRKRVRRDKRAAEKAAYLEETARASAAAQEAMIRRQEAEARQRAAEGVYDSPAKPVVPPTVEEIADDIAGQVVLALAELDDITLDDVIAALDRLREHGDSGDQFCLFPADRD